MTTLAPLKIIIIGAGIGGLTAALSLRRAGHNVHIYETSLLDNEDGGAVQVCPSASRGLVALGLDPVAARFVNVKSTWRVNGETLSSFEVVDERNVLEKYGAPWWLCHRADLIDALKKMAVGAEGEGTPAVLYLNAEALTYSPESGSVMLADGRTVTGDLVIAADGLHSRAVADLTGQPNPARLRKTYNCCYCFLIPTADIAADPKTAHLIENDSGKLKFIVAEGRWLVWYPCRNNEQHNFVAIFSSDQAISGLEDYNDSVEQSSLLETYKNFHPEVLAILKKAKNIRHWPLLYRDPLRTWRNGKVVLLGDAAHPVLPHHGQGAVQAIEDGLAIGLLLCGASPSILLHRLSLYENLRIKRTSTIQILSNTGHYSTDKMYELVKPYMGPFKIPKTPDDLVRYSFGYDIIASVVRTLRREIPGWDVPRGFFEKEPGKGVYPKN